MLNIIYAGTPDVAVPPLDYLANSDKVRVVGVLTREDAPVAADDTAGTVLMRLATSGGALLERTFERLEAGEHGTAQVEDESVSYASKMSIADGRLTWTEPAEQILARYRGVTPEPGAWCELGENRFKIGGLAVADERLVASLTEANGGPLAPGAVRLHAKKVLVGTGTEPLMLLQVQPAGKKMMDAPAWARGAGKDMAEGLVVLA